MKAYYIVGWSSKPEIRPEAIRISEKTYTPDAAMRYCFGTTAKTMTVVSTTRVNDLQVDKRRKALIKELRRKHAARFTSGELVEEKR